MTPNPLKPGFATSEFWIALAPIVGALLAIFGVHVDSNTLTEVLSAVAGIIAAAYVLGRSIVKASHQKSVQTQIFHQTEPAVTTALDPAAKV